MPRTIKAQGPSTGSKPVVMGGDGLTGPNREQDARFGRKSGASDKKEPKKNIPEKMRRIKDPDRIEETKRK